MATGGSGEDNLLTPRQGALQLTAMSHRRSR